VIRQATLVLVAAAALAPAAAAVGRQSDTPKAPSQRVVVRTELVPASDGFDWLDAAAGFGLAIAAVAAVLLVASGYRSARN
jgi:hypothetical protein